MFESSLLTVLKNDAILAATVTSFNGSAAIFNEDAPETAVLPYIVFRIDRTSDESAAVQKFNINVDYYDFGTSRLIAHQASERIEVLLDRKELEHDRYSKIRIFFSSGGEVREDDARAIHENVTFTARAGRKNFAARHTSLGE